MLRWHLPQSVPAWQRWPTSSTVRAPPAITASMVARVTTLHRQIYTRDMRIVLGPLQRMRWGAASLLLRVRPYGGCG